jgi:hypothetical protein
MDEMYMSAGVFISATEPSFARASIWWGLVIPRVIVFSIPSFYNGSRVNSSKSKVFSG